MTLLNPIDMNQCVSFEMVFMNIVKTFVYAFLLTALLSTNTASFAAAPTPGDTQPDIEKIEEEDYFLIFRKLFFSTTYNSLKCQDNIYRLLKEIKTKNRSFEGVKVIFIFDKYHYKILHPEPSQIADQSINRPLITLYKTRIVPTRDMPPNDFRYHVVASVNGRILDFDYSDSPVVLAADEYFKNMFTPDSFSRDQRDSLFNRLTIRAIPAGEYMHQHPRHPSYYLYDLSEKYTASSVNNYLKSILFFLDN
jgi:hypothetical protein